MRLWRKRPVRSFRNRKVIAMKILEFFSEANGSLSSMRLMSFMSVSTALFLVIWQTIHGMAFDLGTMTVLLGAGFGPKVVQKAMEEKTSVST